MTVKFSSRSRTASSCSAWLPLTALCSTQPAHYLKEFHPTHNKAKVDDEVKNRGLKDRGQPLGAGKQPLGKPRPSHHSRLAG